MHRDESYRGVWPGMPTALAASSSCQPACPGLEAALHVLHMTLLRGDTDNEEVTVGHPISARQCRCFGALCSAEVSGN